MTQLIRDTQLIRETDCINHVILYPDVKHIERKKKRLTATSN